MASRSNYKRKWIAASRALKASSSVTNELSESDEMPQSVDAFDNTQLSFHINDCNKTSRDNEPSTPPLPKRPSLKDTSVSEPESDLSDTSDNRDECLSSESDSNNNLASDLCKWASSFNIKQNALDHLLKILRESGHRTLPSCARTLLHTAREIPLEVKSGMEYICYSLKDELLKQLQRFPDEIVKDISSLELSFNVDGLPLFKSSKNSLWPVLCGIMNIKPTAVFPVVLTYGKSKPTNLDFLTEVINDLELLLEEGFKFGSKTLAVSLRCILCDAPAKAFVKGTKLFSGYFGCDKCCQKGLWIGRLVYPESTNLELRTDQSFRTQSQGQHHHVESPFCQLDIDMIKKFPVDYMHQVCLGVTKKLLLLWLRGSRNVRISATQINEVSRRLMLMKNSVPNDFVRKPRGLDEVDRWKATEFRTFLLYTGKIALRGILREDLYAHFLVLNIAIGILVSPTLSSKHNGYARQLLEYFVEQGANLYGEEFLVYNVHSLVHLAADSLEYGPLDEFSAFPFENYMQQIKKLVRSGRNPLVQIAKRLGEVSGQKIDNSSNFDLITTTKPNNNYILSNNSCCEVIDVRNNHDQSQSPSYLCRVYERTLPLFENPCDSRLISVHKVSLEQSLIRVLPMESLTKKAIMVTTHNNKTVFMGLLHKL